MNLDDALYPHLLRREADSRWCHSFGDSSNIWWKARQMMTRLHGYPSERDIRRMSGELCSSSLKRRNKDASSEYFRAPTVDNRIFHTDQSWWQQLWCLRVFPAISDEERTHQKSETERFWRQLSKNNKRKSSVKLTPTFERIADIQSTSRCMRERRKTKKHTISVCNVKLTTNLGKNGTDNFELSDNFS